ncbi:MAG TPA: serine/threonine-protein kinase [Thermoleophilaceae bacterium]|nr:serine/threonine-protein kinase [Thermoleophilaceae bacterium]
MLGRYRLERRLGAGGFGVVWLAWDEKLEREVAVKAIPRERGTGEERVEREARAAARLSHPAIVAIYELAADSDDVYLVSELVRGRTLAELQRAGAIADRDVARIGAALCEALAHAHARGVIHRDVKPQNVMVVAEPAAGVGFAKLADFGVAHVVSGDPLTRTGDVVGTLAYMAPEQADGAPVSGASDVYSLALTLYECWAGRNPVRAGGPAATARRLGRPLPPLRSMRPDLPGELGDAIDDAVDIDPACRPSPEELRSALRAAEADLDDEGGLVEPETLRRVGLPTTERRRGLPRPRFGIQVVQRALAGLAAGGLVLGALEGLGPEPSFSAAAAAGVAALAVALLPRIGWILAMIGVCAWFVSPEADRQGTALVLAAAAAPVPFLLPRAGLLWSVPVLAPLLGTVALAPAFVGVAALAPTAWRRAGLAAAGFLWLALGEAVSGRALLFGSPDGTTPRPDWEGSISAAISDVLQPLVTTPALAPMVVWAAFAALLPLVVRGRWLALDLIGAGLWVAGLATAQLALGNALAADVALDAPRGAISGAIVAAVVVVSVSRVAAPAEGFRAPRVTTA